MAKKKCYAVRNGRVPGIYSTWDECKAQVDGFPGAEYKGFASRDEATAYLKAGIESGTPLKPEGKNHVEKQEEKPGNGPLTASDEAMLKALDAGKAVAFVDGSFDKNTGKYGFAAVLIMKDMAEPEVLSGSGADPELASMRNVAGEIRGAMMAVKWARAHGVEALEIHHDYTGVACWPDGAWKANLQATREYAAFVREARKNMEIAFVKVKGHSGDTYNDMADAAAKKAIGLS